MGSLGVPAKDQSDVDVTSASVRIHSRLLFRPLPPAIVRWCPMLYAFVHRAALSLESCPVRGAGSTPAVRI